MRPRHIRIAATVVTEYTTAFRTVVACYKHHPKTGRVNSCCWLTCVWVKHGIDIVTCLDRVFAPRVGYAMLKSVRVFLNLYRCLRGAWGQQGALATSTACDTQAPQIVHEASRVKLEAYVDATRNQDQEALAKNSTAQSTAASRSSMSIQPSPGRKGHAAIPAFGAERV